MTIYGSAEAKLDAHGLEAIVDDLAGGKSQAAICRELGIADGSFIRWVALDSERSARVKDARILAAHSLVDKAADDLEQAKDAFQLAKARELGFHRRWAASKFNPRDFGDKLQVDNTHAIVNLSDAELEARASQYRTQIAAAEKQLELPPPPETS